MVDFDVVTLPDTDHVGVGDRAPEFTRPLVGPEYWEDTALSAVTAEGPVCLVFHPMDGAFPTTYMYNEIRDRGWTDRLPVIGVSISTPYEHRDLLADRDVDVRLFSDPANDVAEAYGVAHDLDGMEGVSEPRPAVFLVDGDREIRYAWVAGEWPAFPDYDAVDAAIDDLLG
jgi:peroxiredoxin